MKIIDDYKEWNDDIFGIDDFPIFEIILFNIFSMVCKFSRLLAIIILTVTAIIWGVPYIIYKEKFNSDRK